MIRYVVDTPAGMTLDQICFKVYGFTNGAVERVLIEKDVVKGVELSQLPIIPYATVLELPEIEGREAFESSGNPWI